MSQQQMWKRTDEVTRVELRNQQKRQFTEVRKALFRIASSEREILSDYLSDLVSAMRKGNLDFVLDSLCVLYMELKPEPTPEMEQGQDKENNLFYNSEFDDNFQKAKEAAEKLDEQDRSSIACVLWRIASQLDFGEPGDKLHALAFAFSSDPSDQVNVLRKPVLKHFSDDKSHGKPVVFPIKLDTEETDQQLDRIQGKIAAIRGAFKVLKDEISDAHEKLGPVVIPVKLDTAEISQQLDWFQGRITEIQVSFKVLKDDISVMPEELRKPLITVIKNIKLDQLTDLHSDIQDIKDDLLRMGQ